MSDLFGHLPKTPTMHKCATPDCRGIATLGRWYPLWPLEEWFCRDHVPADFWATKGGA